MNLLEEPSIATARVEVLSWLLSQQFGFYHSVAELLDGFMQVVAKETDLDLQTQFNMETHQWEVRWLNDGNPIAEFPNPFCAWKELDARLLACAAMLHLEDYEWASNPAICRPE